jgi:hypothetical protein
MDETRARWVAEALRQAGFSALVCRLPQNIVMLTGYQPILGNSFAVVSLDEGAALPTVRLAIPADETDLIPSTANVAAVTPLTETGAGSPVLLRRGGLRRRPQTVLSH